MKQLLNSTIIAILLFTNSLLYAQQHDNIWLFGYESYLNVQWVGGSTIDFSTAPPDIFYEYRDMNLDINNASICDENGNLLFYTNGVYIADKSNQPMENGDGLNPGIYTDNHSLYGLIIDQGAIALPYPGHSSKYYLIHETKEYPTNNLSWHVKTLYASIIDINGNGGLGTVLEKNIVLIEDTLKVGQITAVKHANGRDWWVVIPELNSNGYYRLLISPQGIENKGVQYVGDVVLSGVGQAIFSPDGTKYTRKNGVSSTIGSFVDIYDFDRCTGLLSNHYNITYPNGIGIGGAAISPNSQFLYIPAGSYVYQFDLEAGNIAASETTVAVYDSFQVEVVPGVFLNTRFFLAQLAPDGKIYINCPGSPNILHVIHNPNEPGLACNLEQHGVVLPRLNNSSIPNFPNYRLGALEGSPCDTILTTSTFTPEALSAIYVFPNPARDYLKIKIEGRHFSTGYFHLFNALGQEVLKQVIFVGTEVSQFSLSAFDDGIYFYKIVMDGKERKSGKVVVNRG